MSLELLSYFVQKHPELSQSRFFLGYTNGGNKGEKIKVFLVRSFWRQYCVTGIAQEPLTPGAVVSLSNDSLWSPEGNWLVYNL